MLIINRRMMSSGTIKHKLMGLENQESVIRQGNAIDKI